MYTLAQDNTIATMRDEAPHLRLTSTSTTGQEAFECKPLWLTEKEAEALLVLCVASPVGAGPCEQELFRKLSDYMRSFP